MTLYLGKYRIESNRLHGYDYSSEGDYYVTICARNRTENIFGTINSNQVVLSDTGKIAEKKWKELPDIFPNMRLGDFVIMPEHMHGIISIYKEGGKSLSEMIGKFKSSSAREIGELTGRKWNEIWQKNFYDHIIHGEIEYYFISEYIKNNPLMVDPDNYFKEWFELQDIRDKIEKAKVEPGPVPGSGVFNGLCRAGTRGRLRGSGQLIR